MPHTPKRFPVPDVAAPQLATCDDLLAEHARLRARGVHQRDGGWVIARPGHIATALALPTMSIAVPEARDESGVGAARRLQRQMARFSDGPEHSGRRTLVERLLPAADGLDAAAERHIADLLRDRTGVVDVMPLARTVPVLVLATALGVPDGDLAAVTAATGRLCDALTPSSAPRASASAGDDAAQQLTDLLAPVGSHDAEQTAAAAGVLFQARDATAALIGAALLADADADAPAACVDAALRRHAPVQCTRRVTTEDVQLDGVPVPAGASVWLVLAAAEQGSPIPATFGAGPHACPGAAHAIGLACGVLTGLRSAGWHAVTGQPVRYEPRPNLRSPATVLIEQR